MHGKVESEKKKGEKKSTVNELSLYFEMKFVYK